MPFEGLLEQKKYIEAEKESSSFLEIREIRKIIEREDDSLLKDLLEDLEDGIKKYFERFLMFEHAKNIAKFTMERDEYIEHIERLDHSRRLTHNALCDKLRILYRAMSKNGLDTNWWEKINGIKEDRYKIGRWALQNAFREEERKISNERRRPKPR